MSPFQLSEVEAFIIVDAARPKSCFSTLFGGVCSVPQWHYTGHSSPKHFVDLFYRFHGIIFVLGHRESISFLVPFKMGQI